MRSEGFNAHTKYRIIQHALKGNNISKTCELFGISRTTFYNWQNAYQKYGITGLENKERKKPKMPNRVSKVVEREILAYISRYPEDGPRRIYYELKAEGIDVGETGIFNVLKRYELTRKQQRIEYSKNKILRNKSNKGNDKEISKLIDLEKFYPGYLITQKIDFMGTFEGIGRIYQYSFYDADSKWVEVKLYNRKNDIDIWSFFESKLVYLLEIFDLSIENLVTEKEREFLPYFLRSHKYDEIISSYNINHFFSSVGDTDVFQGIMEMNEFLVTEFYNKIPLNKELNSFIKLDSVINNFIREYNFTNIITEGPNIGKTPAKIVLERSMENGADLNTLPLWILALINSPRGGAKDE